MTVNLYLNRRITGCPFCKSTHTVIKETKEKHINHCIKPQQHLFIIFHQKKFKCKDCNHTFMENNPIGANISHYGKIQMINQLRNPRKTFSEVAKEHFTTTQHVIDIFDEMVQLNRHHLTKVVCFDEIYSKKLT